MTDLLPPADWKVDSLSDPVFVKRVLQGIKVSRYADKLEDLDKLFRHLSTKNATERAVIKKVWAEFGG